MTTLCALIQHKKQMECQKTGGDKKALKPNDPDAMGAPLIKWDSGSQQRCPSPWDNSFPLMQTMTLQWLNNDKVPLTVSRMLSLREHLALVKNPVCWVNKFSINGLNGLHSVTVP